MMRPPESFIGQPVRSLQTMLRVLAQGSKEELALIPDGIYGPQTQGAVSRFQRKSGLPVTGVTDLRTWETIVAAYDSVLLSREISQLQALQQQLNELYAALHIGITIPPTGELDAATRDGIQHFQQLCGIPQTGIPDGNTCHRLLAHTRQLGK